jgi:hypothetical protein
MARAKRRRMHGKRLKRSPIQKDPTRIRKDSTKVVFNPDTLKVDSTPVGHEFGTKHSGYGWGAAAEHGSQRASMVKGIQDDYATKKQVESDIKKSKHSPPGIGGQRMIILLD